MHWQSVLKWGWDLQKRNAPHASTARSRRNRLSKTPARTKVILVAAGDNWTLWVPAEVWNQMSDRDRRDLVEGQTHIMGERHE